MNHLHTMISILLGLLLETPPAGSQSDLQDRTIELEKTGIIFTIPPGFKPLSKEVMNLKWPNNRAPRFAVGNESASTTIAYDLKPNPFPLEKIYQAQKDFTQMMERSVPGLKWKKNEIIEHQGQKWILMEMSSRAVDLDIYNIMFMTGFQNQMLVFNFNSTTEEFPKYEKQLRESLKSIRLPGSESAPGSKREGLKRGMDSK